MKNGITDQECLEQVMTLVRDASAQVLEVYRRPFDVTRKNDGSPLTEADLVSHEILVAGLTGLLDGTPVISEESETDVMNIRASERFWLVDPLDGTKEFINQTNEFTVNVALVVDRSPRLGVVAAPALEMLYAGISGGGAFRIGSDGIREAIRVNPKPAPGLTVVGSRSHGDPALMERFLEGRRIQAFLPVGSSLKFCRIAEGLADLYPRFGRTMEWDTAAGHAVLDAAGGSVETMEGKPLRYGKPGLDNPHFLARGCQEDQYQSL